MDLRRMKNCGRANWAAECPTFQDDFEPGIWRPWGVQGVPDSVRNLVKMGVLSEEQLEEDQPEIDPALSSRLHAAASLSEAACTSNPFRFLFKWTWKCFQAAIGPEIGS